MALEWSGSISNIFKLVLSIADYLEPADINAFARVDPTLYDLLCDCLYRHNLQHQNGSGLLQASKRGFERVVKRFLQLAKDDKTERTYEIFRSAMFVADGAKHRGVVKLLLRDRIEGDIRMAAYCSFLLVVDILLENNNDPTAKSQLYTQALSSAFCGAGFATIKHLLRMKIDIDTQDGEVLREALTNFNCAYWFLDPDLVKLLLDKIALLPNTPALDKIYGTLIVELSDQDQYSEPTLQRVLANPASTNAQNTCLLRQRHTTGVAGQLRKRLAQMN
ncbi:hypothetical protein BU24DRAFT_415984 [Aaosphaeria arxii CBS 175.79]|uniref:ARM repeat-containing protein n=1 Tax=Aaosphaeria arxii CBS 175.79 TaxID=1450172 RepID=A0A6A5X628_9PLEO|nr:uncharacterized protein BU24DRAFT_415984 [Aaosphaeria arxii CBS 175.79]KAF2008350.1 hypothetical protein BU24DRAFT_415984 [Aaosphaeria arxii CBS 175.79]